MKKKLRKVFMPIFLSVICGFLCGRLMFNIYEERNKNILKSNVIYLLEDISYNDYDTMKSNVNSANYIYYKEEGNYNTVIAMTKNKNNIDKIKSIYNKELSVNEYYLNDININNKIDEYDNKIMNTNNNDEIKAIISEMIDIYKDKEDIKMMKIS